MKKLFAVLAFGLCSLTVQAQNVIMQQITGTGGACIGQDGFGHPCPAPEPALVCGKYQHVYHTDSYTGGGPCSNDICSSTAIYHPEVNECHDDMHEITERDWQALMQRIDKLESQAKK